MQVGKRSEHMRVGFFERKRKNAREQARPEFRLSEAKSTKKRKNCEKVCCEYFF